MRRPVIAASALALALAGSVAIPAAAYARATPAQKIPLTQTNRYCNGGVIGTAQDQAHGFAVIVHPASGKLVANVVLQGGTPNAIYDIRLIQVDQSDCLNVDGTLTTDASGDGNANVQEPVLTGTTSVWVDLNNHAHSTNYFDTRPVSF